MHRDLGVREIQARALLNAPGRKFQGAGGRCGGFSKACSRALTAGTRARCPHVPSADAGLSGLLQSTPRGAAEPQQAPPSPGSVQNTPREAPRSPGPGGVKCGGRGRAGRRGVAGWLGGSAFSPAGCLPPLVAGRQRKAVTQRSKQKSDWRITAGKSGSDC